MNGRYVYDWTIKGNSVVGEDRTWQDIQKAVSEISSIAPKFYSSQDYIGFDGIHVRNLLWNVVDEETMKAWGEEGGGIHALIIEQNHVGHTDFGRCRHPKFVDLLQSDHRQSSLLT